MKLVKILVVLLLLFVIAAAGAFFFLKNQVSETMTPQGIVKLLESEYNLRAEVSGVEGTMEGMRTKVVLTDLVLAARDGVADAGTALSERGKLVPEKHVVFSERVQIDLNLSKLAQRQIEVGELIFANPVLQIQIAEGKNNLAPLFEAPEVVDGKDVAAAAKKPVIQLALVGVPEADAAAESSEEGGKNEGEKEEMNASDLPLRVTASRIAAEGATILIRDLASKNQYRLEETKLELANLDVDPSALAVANHVDLSLSTRLKMDDANGEGTVMNLMIAGEGDAAPFDVETGKLNVAANIDLVLGKGSSFDGHPLLAQLGKALESVAEYGITVADLTSSAILTSDVRTRIAFADSVLNLEEDILLPLERFSIGLKQGGWVNTAENNHALSCALVTSPETTQRVMGEVKEYLDEKVGGTLGSIALKTVTSPLLNEEGNIKVEFRSAESLSDPKVTVDTGIGSIGDSIQNVVKDLLKSEEGIGGLLKGLFNKD
jgi:hypothetical protein